MRVPLTGSAGFIGTAIGELLEAAGDEVVRVDLTLDSAHRATASPARRHTTTRRPRGGVLGKLACRAGRRRRREGPLEGPNPRRPGMFSPANVRLGECA